jgi:hypothetical protein
MYHCQYGAKFRESETLLLVSKYSEKVFMEITNVF